MPLIEIGTAREALHSRGQSYKDLVRRHLISDGLTIVSDSSIGGRADIIAEAGPNQPKVWVECKNRELSIKNKEFAGQFLDYFKAWRALPKQDRFAFRIYVQKLVGKANWTALFEKYDVDETDKWIEWLKNKNVSGDSLPEHEGDLRCFLTRTDVYSAPETQLLWAVSKTTDLHLEEWRAIGQARLVQAQRRDHPLQTKSTIVTNLLKVNPPSTVYLYHTRFRTPRDVYDEIRPHVVPPFLWLGQGQLLSFEPDLEHNPLTGYAQAVDKMPRASLETDNRDSVARLIQEQARAIAHQAGLWRNRHHHFVPIHDKSRGCMRVGSKECSFSTLLRHQETTQYHLKGEVNFGLHEDINFSAVWLDGSWHICLRMGRTFTEDGKRVIEDSDARDAIDRTLRNKPQNRNQGRLTKLQQWADALFKPPTATLQGLSVVDEERGHWVRALNPSGLATHEVPWSPAAADRRIPKLQEFDT